MPQTGGGGGLNGVEITPNLISYEYFGKFEVLEVFAIDVLLDGD